MTPEELIAIEAHANPADIPRLVTALCEVTAERDQLRTQVDVASDLIRRLWDLYKPYFRESARIAQMLTGILADHPTPQDEQEHP